MKQIKKEIVKVDDKNNNEYLDGYEQKFIIYLDDDNSTKNKVAFIKFENNGVSIKLDISQKPFWINSSRILKIKPLREENF